MSARLKALCLTTTLLFGCTSTPADTGPDVPGMVTDAIVVPPTDLGTIPREDAADIGAADVGAADVGAADVGAADVGVVECRAPIPGTDCNRLRQMGAPVEEVQVAGAPPVTTAGFYPAGTYVLTSATVYTGPGGPSGPSGLRYAATLDVHGMGSIDYFDVVQEQAGCPSYSYRFTGDTFGTSTKLFNVTWTCPATCSNCGAPMPYTGTLTTFIVHFPLPGGRTLVDVFTLLP